MEHGIRMWVNVSKECGFTGAKHFDKRDSKRGLFGSRYTGPKASIGPDYWSDETRVSRGFPDQLNYHCYLLQGYEKSSLCYEAFGTRTV